MVKRISIRKRITVSILTFTLLAFPSQSFSQDHHDEETEHIQNTADSHDSDIHAENHGEEKFQPSEFIIDHVKDSHEWHLWTKSDGHHVSVPLPVIVFSKVQGFQMFMSDKIAHGHNYKGFEIGEGAVKLENKKGELVEKSIQGKIIEVDNDGQMVEAGMPLDFSITKNVLAMIISALILLILFLRMGKIYRKEKLVIPTGLSGFLEPMILFIRDEIARPNIGEEKYERFMPYLLTVFFFILINNLMGLVPPMIPFGANVTGNIAVTLVLSVITFFITQFSGTKTYWKHIVATPGVPFWLAPVMIPVEIIGLFSKPFALMVRLFANITAGHIIVLSLVSLIFIFKSIFIAPVSIAFVLFMDCIEILVAFLQAYVFTLLSALFIGLAAKQHH